MGIFKKASKLRLLRRWAELIPVDAALFNELDQPGSQAEQRQAAQQGDLIRLEDAAGVNVEE